MGYLIMPIYTAGLPDCYDIEGTVYKRCYSIRRCYYSGKSLFLRKAYSITYYSYVLPPPDGRTLVQEEFYTWIDRNTYTIMRLKGKL